MKMAVRHDGETYSGNPDLRDLANVPVRDFEKHFREWMDRDEVARELQAKLRADLIINFNKTTLGKRILCHVKNSGSKHLLTLSPLILGLNTLVAEFLYAHNCHFTLSVFCTEVPYRNVLPDFEGMRCFRFDQTEILDIIGAISSNRKCQEILSNHIPKVYRNEENVSLLFLILKNLIDYTKEDSTGMHGDCNSYRSCNTLGMQEQELRRSLKSDIYTKNFKLFNEFLRTLTNKVKEMMQQFENFSQRLMHKLQISKIAKIHNAEELTLSLEHIAEQLKAVASSHTKSSHVDGLRTAIEALGEQFTNCVKSFDNIVKAVILSEELERERELLKEKERVIELEKEHEKECEKVLTTERERERQKEREREREKECEREREKERENERERERERERQCEKERERARDRELEKERLIDRMKVWEKEREKEKIIQQSLVQRRVEQRCASAQTEFAEPVKTYLDWVNEMRNTLNGQKFLEKVEISLNKALEKQKNEMYHETQIKLRHQKELLKIKYKQKILQHAQSARPSSTDTSMEKVKMSDEFANQLAQFEDKQLKILTKLQEQNLESKNLLFKEVKDMHEAEKKKKELELKNIAQVSSQLSEEYPSIPEVQQIVQNQQESKTVALESQHIDQRNENLDPRKRKVDKSNKIIATHKMFYDIAKEINERERNVDHIVFDAKLRMQEIENESNQIEKNFLDYMERQRQQNDAESNVIKEFWKNYSADREKLQKRWIDLTKENINYKIKKSKVHTRQRKSKETVDDLKLKVLPETKHVLNKISSSRTESSTTSTSESLLKNGVKTTKYKNAIQEAKEKFFDDERKYREKTEKLYSRPKINLNEITSIFSSEDMTGKNDILINTGSHPIFHSSVISDENKHNTLPEIVNNNRGDFLNLFKKSINLDKTFTKEKNDEHILIPTSSTEGLTSSNVTIPTGADSISTTSSTSSIASGTTSKQSGDGKQSSALEVVKTRNKFKRCLFPVESITAKALKSTATVASVAATATMATIRATAVENTITTQSHKVSNKNGANVKEVMQIHLKNTINGNKESAQQKRQVKLIQQQDESNNNHYYNNGNSINISSNINVNGSSTENQLLAAEKVGKNINENIAGKKSTNAITITTTSTTTKTSPIPAKRTTVAVAVAAPTETTVAMQMLQQSMEKMQQLFTKKTLSKEKEELTGVVAEDVEGEVELELLNEKLLNENESGIASSVPHAVGDIGTYAERTAYEYKNIKQNLSNVQMPKVITIDEIEAAAKQGDFREAHKIFNAYVAQDLAHVVDVETTEAVAVSATCSIAGKNMIDKIMMEMNSQDLTTTAVVAKESVSSEEEENIIFDKKKKNSEEENYEQNEFGELSEDSDENVDEIAEVEEVGMEEQSDERSSLSDSAFWR